MRISSVDIIPIRPRFADRYEGAAVRMRAIDQRTVFRITCDNGVVGYGDYRCAPPPSAVGEAMVGRSPAAFLRDESLPLGLGAACYDAVGKHLDVPAWQLMGSRQRQRVPVCAWTRPGDAETMASEITRAAEEGYLLLKVHTSQHYDVLEQHRAIDDVAPDGFRMHYDFNHNRTAAAVLPTIEQLRSPRVACIEDPLSLSDLEGWRQLRQRIDVPILMHVPPLGGIQEMLLGCADGYIIAEYCGGFGDALIRAHAYARAGLLNVFQLTGGMLTKAFALHFACTLPAGHTINLVDQYADDITDDVIDIDSGTSPVPEGPGLGIAVDEHKIRELAGRCDLVESDLAVPRHLGRLRLADGRILYTPSIPDLRQLLGFEEGTVRGIDFDVWEDDGSADFAEIDRHVTENGYWFGGDLD